MSKPGEPLIFMDLCQFCQEFAAFLCRGLDEWTNFNWMDYYAPLEGLVERSRHCRFCYLIDYHVAKALDDPKRTFYNRTRFGIQLLPQRSEEIESPLAQIVIRPSAIDISADISMAVWAAPGSPAAESGLISCDLPLPSDNCPEAFDLFRTWFETCFQTHENCRRAIDETLIDEDLGPQLPTRVLDLGEPGTTDVVLVETKGQRGNYCALSYCWGPPGTQTLTTTPETLDERLSGIPFDSMPKTFQDAVQITRQISVRYLWIDGLCIVQGDAEDWTRESKNMGSIYQMASLVISASGAATTQDGCFVSTPRELFSVELPFYSNTGQNHGSFYVCIFSWTDPAPELGPLRTRGWVLQESYLARRSLHFMPGGPSWFCKNARGKDMTGSGLSERNIDTDPGEYSDWESVLQRFSDRKLTHKTDRLMAVEGIATELQKRSRDTYNCGVFLSKIAADILWMCQHTAPESEDLEDKPSWSWASKGVPKIFWGDLFGLQASIDQTKVHIDTQGYLRLRGQIIRCKACRTTLGNQETITDEKLRILFTLVSFLAPDAGAAYMEGTASQCSGIAVFDRQQFHTIYCFCLMSNTVGGLVREEEDTGIAQMLEFLDSDEVVSFVLLLVPIPDRDDCYQRVGMGVMLNPSQGDKSLVKTIHIV